MALHRVHPVGKSGSEVNDVAGHHGCVSGIAEFAGLEFAGLENDGLESDGLEKQNLIRNTTPKSFMKSTLSNSVDER